MENSYRYFENRACKYYPCHEVENDEMNCLFCFCPLYEREHCPDIIMQFLKKKAETEK